MADIDIPFRNEMAFRIITGRKVCTTRTRKYGDVGDIFPVQWEGIRAFAVLTYVEKRKLGFVATFLHDAEGFDNVREFIDAWNEIHPRRGFQSKDERWVHWFQVIKYSGNKPEVVEYNG